MHSYRAPRSIDNQPVIPLLLSLIAAARGFFRSRTDIALESSRCANKSPSWRGSGHDL